MGGDRGAELGFLGDGDGSDAEVVMDVGSMSTETPETVEPAAAVIEPVAETKEEPQPTEASNG